MNFDWSGYLTLAVEMMNKIDNFSDSEAVYRSVVSRAYYAVFCLTRSYVRNIDQTEFYSNVHQELQIYLLNHPHKPRQKIGHQLRQLHQHRIKADYHDELDEPASKKANTALKFAQKITNELTEIF